MINEERRKIQLEALDCLRKNDFNGIFLLPTGTGKSWVLIEALKELCETGSCENIWYLCNTTDLRDVDFINELKKWDAEYLIPKIKRMCYQTAHKIEGEKVDVLIADEFDFSLTDIYSRVYKNNSFKHKILTTAFISSDKIPLIEDVAKIVYYVSLQEVEDKHVLNKSKYNFVNFLMTDEETKIYLGYGNDIREKLSKIAKLRERVHMMDEASASYNTSMRDINYLSFSLTNIANERKRFLNSLDSSAGICRKLMQDIYIEDKDCKILTFCELTKQADKVCKYSYHGNEKTDNLQKFRDNEIQSLSVCGKLNRGVNISNIRYVIFESCNQSKTQLIQRLGRGKRLKYDENLNVYFLIPCYLQGGKIKYTKVYDWITKASNDLDLSKAKNYRFKR